MNKIIVLLNFLGFTLLCHAEVVNFDFFGTNDRGHYNSTTLDHDFQDEYGADIHANAIILIESDATDNERFKIQNKILDDLPTGTFEELATIVVVSLTTEEYMSGYHTSIGTAKRLRAEASNNFRVTILSPIGTVIKRSDTVMNAKEIIRLITSLKHYLLYW
jgi:hypothetical protein